MQGLVCYPFIFSADPDRQARVYLPVGFSQQECDRLIAMLRTLVVDPSGAGSWDGPR